MTRSLAACSLLLLVVGASAPAQAKGCIKGALVGGTVGHFAGHHGVLGAIAGCAIGHHEANKRPHPTRPNQATVNIAPPQRRASNPSARTSDRVLAHGSAVGVRDRLRIELDQMVGSLRRSWP